MISERNCGITMRDGVRLSARVYRPDADGRFPVLLAASPYQYDTDDLPHSTQFLWREVGPIDWYVDKQRYVIVHVDVRGSGHSGGEYALLSADEQKDLYETVEWCARQPWSNGRVGGIGQSYYAWSQWFMGIANPPSLKCIAPYDGSVDLYRDVAYHGGIYGDFLPWWYQMVRVSNLQRPAGGGSGSLMPVDLGRLIAEHTTYDSWWQERSAFERLGQIRVPTFSIGHWGKMGLHLRGNILGYERLTAPKQLLVTGARDAFEAHDLYEQIDFHERELLPFYDRHLKDGAGASDSAAPVRLFVRGIETFRDEAAWPLARARNRELYLNGAPSGSLTSLNDGSLSFEPADGNSTTTFDYPDPQWKLGVAAMGPAGPDPIRRILTYTTPPLDEDLEVTGPAVLELYLASSNTDTDVFVKISDQLPQSEDERKAGMQPKALTMSKGWLRASHRAKDERYSTPSRPYYTHAEPQPLEPDTIVKLEIEVMPFSNVFKAGHRIRLELANGDSPVTETLFVHQYGWFKVGRDTIYHDTLRPSRLILPVVSA